VAVWRLTSLNVDQALLHRSLEAVIQSMSGEMRAGQITMMNEIFEAFVESRHLVVQAGTGTGKSIAYLIPAILYAIQEEKPVVISTSTLALQRQLIRKDLPALVKVLEPILGKVPQFAVAKGRHNYICKLKLNSVEPEPEAAALFETSNSRLARDVKRVRTWAYQSETGDREDLQPAADSRVWKTMSVSGTECIGATRCSFSDDCFAELAREQARSADIIVTNHAMLVLHALEGVPLLPEYCALVVDEGHDLVDRVTSQATSEITPSIVESVIRRVKEFASVASLVKIEEARDGLSLTLAELQKPFARQIVVDIYVYPEAQHAYLVALSQLVNEIKILESAIRDIQTELNAEASHSLDEEGIARRTYAKSSLNDLWKALRRLLSATENDVAWLEAASHTIKIAPLEIAGLLREDLFGGVPVVITSATLKIGGDFQHVARSIGLVAPAVTGEDSVEQNELDWKAIDVGTPFYAAEQGMLYVAADLPPPSKDGIQDIQLERLSDLLQAAGGRTLALFSSWRALERAVEYVEEKKVFEKLGTKLLVQRRGDIVADLVTQFADDVASTLFGTVSLWQGVDVPGESCSLVIIDRIPFPRPDDPLFAARTRHIEQHGGNGFMEVSVNRAALLMAQGSGRLIRSMTDQGMVAVLDSRLATARYREFILRSMPEFTRVADKDKALTFLGSMRNV